MAKIRFTRSVLTSTCGQVQPGDVHDVTDSDSERYIRNGWAEPVRPAKKAAAPKVPVKRKPTAK